MSIPGAGKGALAVETPETLRERLVFHISWLGVRAGKARLDLVESGENRLIRSSARSDDWVSVFYRVRDDAESILDGDGRPIRFRIQQREGRYRSNKETLFSLSEIIYRDYRKKREKRIDPEGRPMYDVLSAFNTLRQRPLVVGTTEYLDICDSGKAYRLEVKILRKDTIEVRDTEVPAIVVEPVFRSDGLFRSTGKTNIWLSDDDQRVPLLMKTEVLIGSVVAELADGTYRPTSP